MTAWLLEGWAIVAAIVTNAVLLGAAISAATRPRKTATSAAPMGCPVLLVRPFRGLDDDACSKHATLLEQTYLPCKVRFVCTSYGDPGLPAAHAACLDDPSRASCCVVDGYDDVVSDKSRNMIATWRSSTERFVAFCDSDLALHHEALAECMSRFDRDTVGAVFAHCVVDSPGPLGRISMLTLTADAYAFLIGAARLGSVPFLEGGLMVLRRAAVEQAGGIEMIAGAIGDDTRLGRRLRRAKFELRLAPFILVHRSERESPAEWIARYRRWLACHRTEVTAGFWSELLLNPTIAPLVALPFFAPGLGWAVVLLSMLVRTATTVFIDRALLRRHGIHLGWWSLLRPVADVIHFLICVSVVVYPWVTWRGIRYHLRPRDMQRAAPPRDVEPKQEIAIDSGAF